MSFSKFLVIFLFEISCISNAQTFIHTELLGRPTDKSITVQVIFKDSTEAQIQYGTTSGVYSNQTTWQTFADSVPAEFVISGLQANTKYVYKLNYRKPGTSVIVKIIFVSCVNLITIDN